MMADSEPPDRTEILDLGHAAPAMGVGPIGDR